MSDRTIPTGPERARAERAGPGDRDARSAATSSAARAGQPPCVHDLLAVAAEFGDIAVDALRTVLACYEAMRAKRRIRDPRTVSETHRPCVRARTRPPRRCRSTPGGLSCRNESCTAALRSSQ